MKWKEFLEKHNLPKQTQNETENLNVLYLSKKLNFVVKNFPTKKTPGPFGFTVNLVKHLVRNNSNPVHTFGENRERGNTYQFSF